MPRDAHFDETEQTHRDSALAPFEKNRFFRGKLLSARDMEVEQTYHADRLHTLTRFTAGTGIVRGLGISEVATTEDSEVSVTVEPGLAVDGIGRPIVVEAATTRRVPEPSGDKLYLQLRHAAVDRETVPIPDTDGASADDQTQNRAVESFEVTYRESPPAASGSPDVSLPDDPDGEQLRAALAGHRERDREGGTDPAVFVGGFERAGDGTWKRIDSGPTRPLVYDNQTLFATVADHLTGGDDPHGTAGTAENSSERVRDDPPAGVEQRLQRVESELSDLQARQDRLRRYVIEKSLGETRRLFEAVATRFDEHEGGAGQQARAVARAAATGDQPLDPTAYRARIEELHAIEANLVEALEGVATSASRDRYAAAVSTLGSRLGESETVLEVALSQDAVAEAGAALEPRYAVVKSR